MSSQSRHSRRSVPTQRSATVLARGARIGVRTTRMPSEAKTTSNDRVNLASRSRTRTVGRRPASCRSQARFRACCVTQSLVGCSVQPAKKTRRMWSSMKNSTC